MSSPKVTAVKVSALSYVGTTWLNLVLGSHEDALTIGPPHRLWDAKDNGFENVCLVHGANDTFWKGFDKAWNREQNFLVALSEYSGKKYFFFDNPHEPFINEVLNSPEVDVKELRYCRDARAVTASYARKFADHDYVSSIKPTGWFYPSFQAIPPDEKLLRVRYEDAVNDLPATLERVGEFLGLSYTENAARFWEFDHHITSGNGGTIATLQLAKGIDIARTPELDFYRQQFEKLKVDPLHGFKDERWRRQLSRRDLFFFDLYLGKKNSEFGYLRDNFSQPEIRIFMEWHSQQVREHGFVPLTDLALETANELQSVSRRKSFKAYDTKYPDTLVWPEQIDADISGARQAEQTNVQSVTGLGKSILLKFLGRAPKEVPVDKGIDNKRIWPPLGPGLIKSLTPTTEYFAEFDPSLYDQVYPYSVKPSQYSAEDISSLIVNNNMHLGYGPDYAEKHPDAMSVDPLMRYRDLLKGLSKIDTLNFKTFREVFGQQAGKIRPPLDNSTVLIRHDVDGDLMAALDMARLEAEYGIKSTYFLLHTAPYYAIVNNNEVHRNDESIEFYKAIEALGHEIALHSDSQTLYQTYNLDGAKAIEKEIEWLRSHGIAVEGTLAHNSFGVYGANNYTVFKDRPLTDYYMPGEAKCVVHNTKTSFIQQLDEAELGLTYEGNEVFWQDDDPVRYYCLMHQSMWFRTDDLHGTLQHVDTRPKQKSTWISQEEVLDDAATIPPGQFCVIVVHPLHYGLRTQAHENPNATLQHALEAGDIKLADDNGWVQAVVQPQADNSAAKKSGFVTVKQKDRRDSQLAYGFVGEHLEFASPFVPNERGLNERPDSRFREAEKQILVTGGKQFAGRTLPTDSRVSQLVPQYLTFRHAASLGFLSSYHPADNSLQKAIDEMALKENGYLIVGLCEKHLSDTAFLEEINFQHNKGRPVLAVLEGEYENLSAFTSMIEKEASGDLLSKFETVLDCPVISPFERFAEYSKSSSEKLMWSSCPEWSYQAHSIVADIIAQWVAKTYDGE